jgi:hypothetical protein
MTRVVLACAALAAALPLSAQLIVSPASVATTEGNSNNTFPFNNIFRYQQVHGDLRGTPFAMKGIQIRGDGSFNSAARTVDMEIFVSNGPYVGFSQVFDRNHGPVRINVFTRKMVNLPAFTIPMPPPAAFTAIFPFDTQYPHTGNFDVVWEARIYSNTSTASYIMDANSNTPADVASRSATLFGTGCVATGRTLAMAAGSQFHTYRMANSHAAVFWSVNGPATTPSTILIGTTALDLPIPGACTNLYVSPMVAFGGSTDADGLFAIGPFHAAYDPALVGASLISQGAGLDPARADPIKLSASNRATNSFPAQSTGSAALIRRLWLSGNPTGPVGSMDANYGVVIGFDR